jgi:phosphoadenosine phosphosulfate reductase
MNAPLRNSALDIKVACLEQALRNAADENSPAALSSSLAVEDMVISDVILRHGLRIEIFTLDTGRLHQQTLQVLDRVHERYGYAIQVFRPDQAKVDDYVRELGLDAIYRSVELRQRCCHIRKVEPLDRALEGKRAWITGMRRSQSSTRRELLGREFDAQRGLWKYNPLADWSEKDVWDYIRSFDVPYNALQDQGYRSIGCEPCTRPTAVGEDLRAGRWWWEDAHTKECGLHAKPVNGATLPGSVQ